MQAEQSNGLMQVYPTTMQYITRGWANVLSIMWFITLFLLGIDSLFALTEGVRTLDIPVRLT